MKDSFMPRVCIQKTFVFFLLFIGLVFCIHSDSLAGSYWVSPKGRDTNQGSLKSPWKTLQHAVDSIKPGDVIWVKSGVYQGCRIEKSGTSQAYKVLKAANGARVVINRSGPKNKHDSIIEFETWEGSQKVAYWVLQGFEIIKAKRYGIDIRGNATNHSHHINIINNKVGSSRKTGIFTAFCDDVKIIGNNTYSNGEHGIYCSNSGDRPKVTDNISHHNKACGIHFNGDKSMGGDGLISGAKIERNTIYQNGDLGGAGINLDGVYSSYIAYNFLYSNKAGGIALFRQNGAKASSYNRVYYNTLYMPKNSRWAINLAQAQCVNNKVIGNTIYTESFRGSICLAIANLPGFVSRNNYLTGVFSFDSGDSKVGFTAWRAKGYGYKTRLITKSQRTYRVRGRVLAGRRGLAGVKISFGKSAGYLLTDKWGRFSKILPQTYIDRITPEAACRTFSPWSKYIRDLNSNHNLVFKSTRGVVFKGRVLFKNKGLKRVVIVFSRPVKKVRTTTNGYFSRNLPCLYTGVARPYLKGYYFRPAKFVLKRQRQSQTVVIRAYKK